MGVKSYYNPIISPIIWPTALQHPPEGSLTAHYVANGIIHKVLMYFLFLYCNHFWSSKWLDFNTAHIGGLCGPLLWPLLIIGIYYLLVFLTKWWDFFKLNAQHLQAFRPILRYTFGAETSDYYISLDKCIFIFIFWSLYCIPRPHYCSIIGWYSNITAYYGIVLLFFTGTTVFLLMKYWHVYLCILTEKSVKKKCLQLYLFFSLNTLVDLCHLLEKRCVWH